MKILRIDGFSPVKSRLKGLPLPEISLELVLDFMMPPLMCGLGVDGPVQSNHCERTRRRVRLMRVCVRFETAVVKPNDAESRVLDAPRRVRQR